jgi:hypothetical protein
MEKKNTLLSVAFAMLLAITLLGCSKTASAPKEEVKGPTETVVLNMVDISNNNVGTLYIDNMNGKAQARIKMDSGYYTAGTDMKANVTLTDANGTAVYALCTDVSGKDGQCKTYPITVLKDNSDAVYQSITSTNGIVFNVYDKDNKVYARSTKQTIVIDN